MRFLGAFCLLALAGCAKLSVRVEVFDNTYLDSAEVIVTDAEQAVARVERNKADDRYNEMRAALKVDLGTALAKAAAAALTAEGAGEMMAAQAETIIDAKFAEAMLAYEKAIASARKARTFGADRDRRVELFREAGMHVARGDRVLLALDEEFTRVFDELPGGDGPGTLALLESREAVQNAVSEAVGSLIGDAGLFDDPMASAVIHAPDGAWDGTFNRSFGWGLFGNTDIAIKMESLGVFTVKGLRMDGTQVTAATFKVLSQGVKLLAASTGLPATGAGGEPRATPVSDADAKRREAQGKQRIGRSASVALLDTILAEREALADPARRAAAIQRIQSAFAVYKPNLDGGTGR